MKRTLRFFAILVSGFIVSLKAGNAETPTPVKLQTFVTSSPLSTPTPARVHASSAHAPKGKAASLGPKKTSAEGKILIPDPVFYARLNAELSPLFKDQAPTPTGAEKAIGAVLQGASYGCAAVAGAQVLGILPSDNKLKK
ncbi:MAG TPA: hypothetical protein VMV05_04855 [bacterium]|nr:hypothetical protein [bacterium]